MQTRAPQIVVLGAGFGGLTFCQAFRHATAEITLVDRANHHLFQPLLYQVATAGLSAPEIAQPIRGILAHQPRINVRMDKVTGFDLEQRRVRLEGGELPYDYLVLALGGVTSYFGHPEWEEVAPGLKSLEDAQRIRREVLFAFERAENEPDPQARQRLMTLVVIGGGPTGVELAGAVAELARHVLRSDFRHIDPSHARVILIEGSPRLLAHLPESLGESARQTLIGMGVEVRTGTKVVNLTAGRVELEKEVIEAGNILWAAGVAASPLTKQLGVELDRAGRVKVQPDLSLPGHPEVFAIGDMAALVDKNGVTVPGVSPAAMQEARHVARQIADELDSVPDSRRPFAYWDKGTMATIGRSAAVAKVGPLEFTGFLAWLAWLGVHLIFLVGFRSKLAVLLQWAYSYCTYKRGARIITGLKR